MPRLRPAGTRYRFRTRLFTILLLFAVCPSVLLTTLWIGTVTRALPLMSGSGAWERAAATGERALALARARTPDPAAARAFDVHEQELRRSIELARRYSFVAPRFGRVLLVSGVVGVALLIVGASRVAGHLSRQLSRPLDQLVRWTALVQAGQALPDEPEPRGAPEFRTLRRRMRTMSRELAAGRARALEAERAEAFRETARRVAHELKNPLTPIRFAVERLRRDATPAQAEAVEVLAAETARLEKMARSFAQFGRLPDGPAADVDLGELARWAVATAVPEQLEGRVEVDDDLPLVRGHYDALARALHNVLLNAVEATPAGGRITVRVQHARGPQVPVGAVEVAVHDTGGGIAPELLQRIWDPYVTQKAHGTGLGLAIARQTVLAHGGAVDAVSAVGRGTEVRFILPVAPSEALTTSFTSHPVTPARSPA
ncbi:HAMP domain-containing sensor histidine kinase [Roseisolibacter sp. H3M3-2]|uniref:sensor histidine kinase n=1 Tax=Roseisolibacter sp. H3M3-2 TaxID=3031323 RepID=UPI0023DB6564|nr:HAMP domain-containing sensor histidine kinase [Roseisolibacter sp. H3M3-2]MDF1502796.1 HAMP domain-containing sensor histidine kinase [Roseisolibacter sp. H3M3-2]